MKRTGPSNIVLRELIKELNKLSSKQKINLWKRVAKDLNRPSRIRRKVNLYKINENAKENETVIVPGKVLATGDINKKITISAFDFSERAKEKINQKGKAISIQELMKSNPKGNKVRILG